MANIPNQQQDTGSNIPTTQIWDTQQIYSANLDDNLEELFVRMYQNLGLMADAINKKEFGYYLNQPLVNGKAFYNSAATAQVNSEEQLRPNYRTVVNFPLISSGSNTQPHGLTIGPTWQFTFIGGVANSYTFSSYFPLLYGDSSSGGILVNLDNINVNIINNTGIDFELPTDVTIEWNTF